MFVAPKKIVKKEHRKSDSHVVEALGPALFSTPDIIRRVGSTHEPKLPDISVTTAATSTMLTTISHNTSINPPAITTAVNVTTTSTSSASTSMLPMNVPNMLDEPMDTSTSANTSVDGTIGSKFASDASILSDTLGDDKIDSKVSIAELLQPALDSGKYIFYR